MLVLTKRLAAALLAGSIFVTASASAASEMVIHPFHGEPGDGKDPQSSLIYVGGALYGTTLEGGNAGGGANNGGTVFEVTTSGTEKVLHNFQGGTDGVAPTAGLVNVHGALFGMSAGGGGTGCGGTGCGTVFKINPNTGAEQVIYSFNGGVDGYNPNYSLIVVGGILYGTTEIGGGSGCESNIGCGTVFSVTTSGKETVLYSFKGGKDGWWPEAGLFNVGGVFYGTTTFGGGTGCGGSGCGVVFAVTPEGNENVLYRFKGGSDGYMPHAGLINVNGALYGTTEYGGGTGCGSGCGTVFSVSTSGTEKVLYTFQGGSDGCNPITSLIDVKGKLYGTTVDCGANFVGTVFSVTTSGTESIVYAFQGGSDGAFPYSGVVDVKGTLYGTTTVGGDNTCLPGTGCGTVFSVTP
jgi:uncharacterized repeat protein (TIGR03803 family)